MAPGASRNWRVKLVPAVPSDAFHSPLATQPVPLTVVCSELTSADQRTKSPCSRICVLGWKTSVLSTVEMRTRGTAMSTPGSTAIAVPAHTANDRAAHWNSGLDQDRFRMVDDLRQVGPRQADCSKPLDATTAPRRWQTPKRRTGAL